MTGRRLIPLTSRLSGLLHLIGVYAGIPALILIIGTDVVLRYVVNRPLRWGNEVSALIQLAVLVGSLTLCTEQRGHVRMDALYVRSGPRLRRATDALANLCGFVFAACLTYQCFASTVEMYRFNQGAEMIDLPYWPFALFMGLCAALLALRFALEICGCADPAGATAPPFAESR
jgi:TRAP-type C4-dicarboxylate transport system permease small subunit